MAAADIPESPSQPLPIAMIHTTPIRLLSLITLSASLMAMVPAHAGRPLQTEDAGIIDLGGCELEGAATRLTSQGAAHTERGLTLACGIGRQSQVGLNLSRLRDDGGGTPVVGTGAQLLGKTRLWKGTGDDGATTTLAWTLAWQHERSMPWQHVAKRLNLVTSLPMGGGTVHLNLGHARDTQGKANSTTWNAAYEDSGFDWLGMTWQPMAELFGDDRSAPSWNVALRATVLPERLTMDLSWGRQINPEKPRLVTAGFKLSF